MKPRTELKADLAEVYAELNSAYDEWAKTRDKRDRSWDDWINEADGERAQGPDRGSRSRVSLVVSGGVARMSVERT